jgi:hypothetical protein
VTAPPLPSRSDHAYLWWSQGAADEAKARDEGLSPQAIELRDLIEALAKSWGASASMTSLVCAAARICAPHVLRRRHRK